MERSFAQQLLEQLSENISQLILTVLIIKEQNANLPVVEVSAIANAASSISDVALQLANTEYSKFENIYKEIVETSAKMSKIKQQTLYAISNFNQNDKKTSWDNLIESCKSIANETYKILQVIYDADIKRLEYLNQLCLNQLNLNLNSFHLVDNSEFNKFGDIINESISSLLEYSSYVIVKSKEIKDVVPLVSEELIELSNQIESQGNQLIDIVNDMFADIDDPSQKQLFINQQNKLVQLLKQTFELVQLNSPSLSLSFNTDGNNQTPQQSREHDELLNRIKQDKIANISILDDLVRGLSKSCIEDLRSVCRVDPVANDIISNSIEKLVPILDDNVNKFIKQNSSSTIDDDQEHKLRESIQKLKNELIPIFLEKSKSVINKQQQLQLQQPTTVNQGEVQQDINKVVELLDNIQDQLLQIGSICSSKEQQFLNTIKAKEDVLAILQDNAIENPAAIVGTLKHLAKNQTQLESMLNENDPEEINEAVSKLSELLPLQIQAAKLYLKDPLNSDNRKQFQEIGDRMKVPLSKIVSLMEPNKYSDGDEILAKQINAPTLIIEAAKQGDQNKVNSILSELEMANATLVSIVQGETMLVDDPLLEKMVKSTHDQLLQHISERRGLANKLLKDPMNKDLQNQLIQTNQKIASLSKSLTDSMKSLEAIPLLKIQLLEQANKNNVNQVQSILKDINNRINAIIYNGNNLNDNLLGNNNNEEQELLSKEIKELENYLNQLNKEINQSIKSNQPLSKINDDLDYTTNNIINKLNSINDLSNKLYDKIVNNNNSNNDDDNSNGNIKQSTSTSSLLSLMTTPPLDSNQLLSDEFNDQLYKKEFELIQENKENERKLQEQEEEEFKKLELLSNDQKLLTLFNDLIQHIKKSEANKSMLTLKQLIAEQDKLIQLANEISLKTKSQSFKDQIQLSTQLFKNSVALSISLAGKANLPENQQLLTKATNTVKKSIIELTHLLKLNPNIELLASYQLIKSKQLDNDLIDHIKLYSNDENNKLEYSNNELDHQSLNSIKGQLALLNKFNEHDIIIKGFEKHQLNSRYYIQTAYEVDKDDLISNAIQQIVYHQSELLLLASEFLNSQELVNLDPNIKKLLGNSVETVKKSIIEQVESSLLFLDTKSSPSSVENNKQEAIEKLLIVIDTVRDSVSNCAKSIFKAKVNQQNSPTFSSETIKQSINSVLPSLTLAKTKLNSNPQDNQFKSDYEKILNQIIEPLEDLILNQNFNENFKLQDGDPLKDDNTDDNDDKSFKKLKKLINDENIELNKLELNALESDSKGVVESSRVLVRLHQEIVGLADQMLNDDTIPPIGGNEDLIKESSKELTLLIPLQLTTIKQMLQSKDMPTEASLQQKISHINNQIKRNLQQIENQINPTLPHLKVPFYRDQFKKIAKVLDNNGQLHQNEKKFNNNLNKLLNIANQSLDAGNNELLKVFDKDKQRRVREACEELEKRLNKNQPNNLTNTIQLYSLNSKNPANRSLFDKESTLFQDQLNKLSDETNTNSLELLSNHLDLIQKLVLNSSKLSNNGGGSGSGKIDELSKQLLSNYSKLKSQLSKDLNNINNPEKKSIIISSLNEIEKLTPELLVSSKNAFNQPDNQNKREQLESNLNNIETPIYEIFAQLDSIDPIYNFETIIKEHQSLLNQLNDSLKSGDESQVTQLTNKLENIQNHKIFPFIKNNQQPHQQHLIETHIKSKMSDVLTISKDYLKNYSSITPNIIAEQEMAFSALKNAINAVYSNEIPQLLEKRDQISQNSQSKSKNLQQLVASIKSNNLLPIAATPSKIEKFVSAQTNTQQPVFQRVTSTARVNYKPRTMSISQKLINTNNTVAKSTPTVSSTNKPTSSSSNNPSVVVSKPAPIPTPTPTPTPTSTPTSTPISVTQPQQNQETRKPVKLSAAPTPIQSNKSNPIQTPKPITTTKNNNNNNASLEDSFINASNQILNSNNQLDNLQVSNIAKELETYANAIKTNQKQLMVLCSRNISVLLNKYADEVSATAKSSSNRLLQGRMGHSVNVLKTLSCQFKILTGVKAASTTDQDADSDFQLTSLVKLLSSTLLDLNTSLVTNSKVNKK